ncbi:hypothetical protein JCM17380_26180 [Desulfosporosinus burensis]
MSWIQKLYETYENCSFMIGNGANEADIPLLPICHTTQMAQVEMVVDQDGNFKRARVVPKNEARTIIPCTEGSGGRAGIKPVNHPLCDKIQYLAGDFIAYGGIVTTGYTKDPKKPYEMYTEDLKNWCKSEHTHPKARAVLKYIEKRSVIKDLVNNQILVIDDKGKLLDKWDKRNKDTPEIFKVTNTSQSDVFVRWSVEIPDDPQSMLWNDNSLFESWIAYYSSVKVNNDLCYVTGESKPVAEQHPAKIKNDADKAKLISSNDTSGFTFRGRFKTADQACTVGFEITQKAHNALRWLVGRQGYRRGEQVIVAWAIAGQQIPDPLADALDFIGAQDLLGCQQEKTVSTAQELALKLKQKIAGFSVQLGDTSEIVVMGMASATPGRMAITYYKELRGSEFLTRIEDWHETCAWIHDYRIVEPSVVKKGEPKKVHVRFFGAPAPGDIAEAAYGRRLDDKLRKATVERILPCIIDRQKIPRDLVKSAVRRASNRIGMDDWEWKKTLSIACALFKKMSHDYLKEDYQMALDDTRDSRDYLYGRLLALADSLEQWALKSAGEKRQTNAGRLMQRFSEHPYSTWRTIELSLNPYIARLGPASAKRLNMITRVTAMFKPEDFISDKRLSGEFLLGYHCQLENLWKSESN